MCDVKIARFLLCAAQVFVQAREDYQTDIFLSCVLHARCLARPRHDKNRSIIIMFAVICTVDSLKHIMLEIHGVT